MEKIEECEKMHKHYEDQVWFVYQKNLNLKIMNNSYQYFYFNSKTKFPPHRGELNNTNRKPEHKAIGTGRTKQLCITRRKTAPS